MKNSNLLERLLNLSKSDEYPFHMPGHKRQIMNFPNPFSLDITEIKGFDNLHHPEGLLRDSMEFAANLYGSDKSYYLINGSTAGILSAICATTKRGDRILMARNCHQSVYHGVFLQELNPVYCYPQNLLEQQLNCGLDPSEIDLLLKKNKDIQMVFITSPTYEGVVSDIAEIAAIVHKYNIPLIVDEAHGAHFTFGEIFPQSALNLGADIVIQSLHKTLPSLTQTGIMHIKKQYINNDELERYLSIYQSSSPSYILLASIEECLRFMNNEGRKNMKLYEKKLLKLRKRLDDLKHLEILNPRLIGQYGIFDLDQSKIVILTNKTNFNGIEIQKKLLSKYHLQMEMSGSNYTLAMTAIGDTEQGLSRLGDALMEIDQSIEKSYIPNRKSVGIPSIQPVQIYNIYKAGNSSTKKISFKDAKGKISSEFIYAYPPGIPILTPGEEISDEILEYITLYKTQGISLQGTKDKSLEMIEVVK